MSDSAPSVELSSIDLLNIKAPVQHSIVDSKYELYYPIAGVDNSEIEFIITNSGDWFIDLFNSVLELAYRIKKENGDNLDADDPVSTINYSGNTFFDVVCIWLNGVLISQTENYAHRAIIDVLMNCGRDATESWLQAGQFYKDDAGQMDNANPSPTGANAPVNNGLKKRFQKTTLSKLVTTKAKVHLDIFNQERHLINYVTIRIKLRKNKDEFCLMSSSDNASYKLDLERVVFRIKKVKPSMKTINKYKKDNFIYPINRVHVKEHLVTAGGYDFNVDNFVVKNLPTKIVFGFITNNVRNGSYTLNPFNFKHSNISSFNLKIGNETINGEPLNFNFTDQNYLDGYLSLVECTGKKWNNEGLIINRDDYGNGYTLIAFDLSPTTADGVGQYRDPSQEGDLHIRVKFSQPILEPLVMIAYMVFENEIIINPERVVTVDYKP